ncbi:MAG TPA: EthD family reductase [Casimicrobiaceae bacterium]|nr:EthD family reductase [Casimicrobiaceae bacterium]
MAAAKLIVIYPTPANLEAFEHAYSTGHIPMAAPIFEAAGATKVVLTLVSAAASGPAPYHRIAEIHFPSMQALNACAASQGGRDALADAARISNGGAPIVLIATEDVVTFAGR